MGVKKRGGNRETFVTLKSIGNFQEFDRMWKKVRLEYLRASADWKIPGETPRATYQRGDGMWGIGGVSMGAEDIRKVQRLLGVSLLAQRREDARGQRGGGGKNDKL